MVIDQALKTGALADFKAAWDAARGEKSLPTRADISLRRFARFVPNMSAYERFGPREFRYSQAGENLRDRLDIKVPDTNFFDYLAPEVADDSEIYWNLQIDQPCGGLQEYSMEYPDGRMRRMISINLPILKKEGGPVMLIACTEVLEEAFLRAGRNRAILGEQLTRARLIDAGFGVPAHRVAQFDHEPVPRFMERLIALPTV